MAKGGRRLRSAFENALDLLTVCRIVFLRKSSESLDLLTEAQVITRYPLLRSDLAALYAGYYVAELLSDWTEDYDPHPALFDEALDTLAHLGTEPALTGPRTMRFETVLLRELGYAPSLELCAGCQAPVGPRRLGFCPAAGGVLCPGCQGRQRGWRPLSAAAWQGLRQLAEAGDGWRRLGDGAVRAEVRQVLGQYVTYRMGRRPRLLPYLRS